MSPLQAISASVFVLIGVGLYYRHRLPSRHLTLMALAFACDLGLLVWIESSRHAVAKVAGAVEPIVYVHVGASCGVLLGYLALGLLGFGLRGGREHWRVTHRLVGMTFLGLRVVNFTTSFMVGSAVNHTTSQPLAASSVSSGCLKRAPQLAEIRLVGWSNKSLDATEEMRHGSSSRDSRAVLR